MKTLAAALVFFVAAIDLASAQSEPLKVYILANGRVRFDSGPELDHDQLLKKIHELEKQEPHPELRVTAATTAKYAEVAKVFALFQREGYGPHFGIVAFAFTGTEGKR